MSPPLTVAALAAAALAAQASSSSFPFPLPRPSGTQLDFIGSGKTQFMHFGMCTFHGCQQNSPFFPATTFNPTFADTDQWVQVAKSWGASRVCLTVRHTGGFALWPTKVYNYSIAGSPYQNGTGDIVRDFVDSCNLHGVEPCFYFIPSWNNFATEGMNITDPEEYVQVELALLQELLTTYGPVSRIWFDNFFLDATSCQPAPNQNAAFVGQENLMKTWSRIIGSAQLVSPNTLLFPGPGGCLNPGEAGSGVYPVWNYQSGVPVYWGCENAAPQPSGGGGGGGGGGYYSVVHESVISVLNPGDFFFWDASDPILPADQIFSHYTLAVGQGSNFNLNVPPDRTGSIPQAIIEQVSAFADIVRETYGSPVAAAPNLPVSAPCPELVVVLDLPPGAQWDQTVLVEGMALGPQLISAYHFEAHNATDDTWYSISGDGFHGGTVGYRIVDWGFAPAAALQPDAIRFVCDASVDDTQPATIAQFGAFLGRMGATEALQKYLGPNGLWASKRG
jgi:alpha-L-fucosidase